ncbi:hypothetical protein ACFYPA_36670 [Streptomyces sp. NPDC005775]|uniref:hypothetical protein n=1 Tax=Streptomyces sp. NPDC005775 TaxID=3364729 RepID=UPI0036ABD290
MDDRTNDLPAGMTGSPEHARIDDGDQQQPPPWLEDIAHERLVAETYTRLHAAEDAAAAVDRIRADLVRPHPPVPADRRPHPLRLLALRLHAVLTVTLLLPVVLADYAHYVMTRRFIHRLTPVTDWIDNYLYRLETRLTDCGDEQFVNGFARHLDRTTDGLDALLARFRSPR